VLGPEVAAGATGLLIEATHPVSAGLRSFVDGDLAHTVVAPPVFDETAALVPSGAQRLLLAGALRPGVATVVARAAGGRELATERLEIGPDRSVAVRLPDGTAYVAVQLSRTEGVVSVLVTSPAGVTVVPLRQTVRNGLVPQVGPARP